MGGDIVLAVAGRGLWRRRLIELGRSPVQVDDELFSGKTSGDIVTSLTLDRHGTCRYYV
jgi:hypothetical protein